jgi:hypothetical protein
MRKEKDTLVLPLQTWSWHLLGGCKGAIVLDPTSLLVK